MTTVIPKPIGHYSPVVSAGDFFFFSGQISLDPKTNEVMLFNNDVVKQTELILKNIDALLAQEGLTKEQIVKATIYLKDISKFPAVNEIYAKYFGNHKPARTTIEVSGLPKNVAIEIEIIATNN